MPGIAEQAGPVTGGVDTHAGVHVAAVAGRVGPGAGHPGLPGHGGRVPGRAGVDERARRAGQGRGGGHRQLRRRAGRSQRRSIREAHEPRRGSRVHPGAESGPGRRDQGPHPRQATSFAA
jgi:hypothetical protein